MQVRRRAKSCSRWRRSVVGDRPPLAKGEVAAACATISRTGYTGEDGFEIFVPPDVADRLYSILEAAVNGDSVRGRARYAAPRGSNAVAGNDIDETTSVLEAGLGWTIGWKKATSSDAIVCWSRKSAGSRAGWSASK